MATTQRLGIDIVATDKTRGGFSSVIRQMSDMTRAAGVVRNVLGGMFAGLSVGAVGAALKSQINAMDELSKSAQKIGVPVEKLSTLEYAARLADVSLGELETSVGKLSKSMAEIQGGRNNDAGAALKALGISAMDAQGQLRPVTDIMDDVADKFVGLQDGANKTAIAYALFGRSGTGLIPMLNEGSAALQQMQDQATAFGLKLSGEAGRAAEHFNDNLTALGGATEGLARSITSAALPALNNLTDGMVAFASNGDNVTAVTGFMTEGLERFASMARSTAKEIQFLVDGYNALASIPGKLMPPGPLDPQRAGMPRLDLGHGASVPNPDYLQPWENNGWRPGGAEPGKPQLPGMWYAPPTVKLPDAPALSLGSDKVPAIKKQVDEAAKALEKLKAEGQAVWEDTRTPLEKYQIEVRKLNDLHDAGAIDTQTYGRAMEKLQDDFTGAAREANKLGMQVADTLAPAFSDWLGKAIDGTFSLRDALGELAKTLGSSLIQQGINGLLGGTSSGGGGIFGALFGAIAPSQAPMAALAPMRSMAPAPAARVEVTLSKDLEARFDQKINNASRQAVQVSVAESGRRGRQDFGANYRDTQVRQG